MFDGEVNMPRYEFDPTGVQATIEVFPKGDYEMQVGEGKAFIRTNRKGNDSYGVRYPVIIKTPGPHENKRTFYSAYLHTDGGQAYAKQFLMAALGYPRNNVAEQEFNRAVAGKDWSFDPATGHIGEVWKQVEGQRLIVSLDETVNEETKEPMQQFTSFRPLE